MDILNMLIKGIDGGETKQVGRQLGLDDEQLQKLIGAVVPGLAGGMQRNVKSSGGIDALANALQRGNHQRYVDEPEALNDSGAIEDGNGILGHLLGSKDVSRKLASQASATTGIDTDIIKKALPLLAAVFMGNLAKKTNGGEELKSDSSGGMLGSILGEAGGGALGELAGLASKFLK